MELKSGRVDAINPTTILNKLGQWPSFSSYATDMRGGSFAESTLQAILPCRYRIYVRAVALLSTI